MDVLQIDVGLVVPDPEQPRRDFAGPKIPPETQAALEELAHNIQRHGVLEPILVRRENEFFRIVCGERRWRASVIAGLKTIPAIVKTFESAAEIRLAQLSENIQREDMSALDVGDMLARIIDESGMTQSALARQLGKTKSFVSMHIAMTRPGSEIRADAMRLLGYIAANIFDRLPEPLQLQVMSDYNRTGDKKYLSQQYLRSLAQQADDYAGEVKAQVVDFKVMDDDYVDKPLPFDIKIFGAPDASFEMDTAFIRSDDGFVLPERPAPSAKRHEPLPISISLKPSAWRAILVNAGIGAPEDDSMLPAAIYDFSRKLPEVS